MGDEFTVRLKPEQEPWFVSLPDHYLVHDDSALTSFEPRRPGVPRPNQAIDEEIRAIALFYWAREVAERLFPGREDVRSTVAVTLRSLARAAAKTGLKGFRLKQAAVAAIAASIYAHGVPVSNSEIAEAMGMELRKFIRSFSRGLRILQEIGVPVPRTSREARAARLMGLARRLAAENGLPTSAVNLAGELALALSRVIRKFTWQENLAAASAYLAGRLLGYKVKDANEIVPGTVASKAGNVKYMISLAVVYPPADGRKAKPVKVALGDSRLRMYCAACGAIVLDKMDSSIQKYKLNSPPERCPSCGARLDSRKPLIIVSPKDGRVRTLTAEPPGSGPQVKAVK